MIVLAASTSILARSQSAILSISTSAVPPHPNRIPSRSLSYWQMRRANQSRTVRVSVDIVRTLFSQVYHHLLRPRWVVIRIQLPVPVRRPIERTPQANLHPMDFLAPDPQIGLRRVVHPRVIICLNLFHYKRLLGSPGCLGDPLRALAGLKGDDIVMISSISGGCLLNALASCVEHCLQRF